MNLFFPNVMIISETLDTILPAAFRALFRDLFVVLGRARRPLPDKLNACMWHAKKVMNRNIQQALSIVRVRLLKFKPRFHFINKAAWNLIIEETL